MQFQPIKTGLRGVLSGRYKRIGDAVHICACHGGWHLIGRAKRNTAGGNEWPVACCERLVSLFPANLRRALGAAVANLQADFCAAARCVRKINNPF